MTYQEMIASAPVVLVEFYADWCPHCRKMMPVVAQVSELLEGRTKVCPLEIDNNSEAADYAGAQSVPTFILYQQGKECWRHNGEIDGEVLLAKVEDAL